MLCVVAPDRAINNYHCEASNYSFNQEEVVALTRFLGGKASGKECRANYQKLINYANMQIRAIDTLAKF